MKEHRIDFIAEAFSEKDAPDIHKVTQVLAPTVEVWTEVNRGKRWRILKVEASPQQLPGLRPVNQPR